jgi:glycosyltransferase involved in cell wall biosynthesis
VIEEREVFGRAAARKIRIVHVITSLQRGGAESVLARLVLATRRDFDHVVISLRDENHFGPMLRRAGVEVHALQIGRGRGLIRGILHLARLVDQPKAALVQTWLYHADLLGGLAARLAGKRPIIWGVRNTNLGPEAIRRATRLVAWMSARLSPVIPDAIVCNSVEATRVHIAFGYCARLFRLIPNGYDVDQFRPNPELRATVRRQFAVAPGDILIGNIARWDAQKDHATLLAALRRVITRHGNVRVLLVGDGIEASNPRLGTLVREAGLEGHVLLCGPRNDVPAIMNALDLHVTSSLGEAFPNAVAEAMACGTPCVVTDVGDSARIVGTTGWISRPRDHVSLATAIEDALAALASDGESRRAACRARIVENFELTRMTAAYAALWREFASHSSEHST